MTTKRHWSDRFGDWRKPRYWDRRLGPDERGRECLWYKLVDRTAGQSAASIEKFKSEVDRRTIAITLWYMRTQLRELVAKGPPE